MRPVDLSVTRSTSGWRWNAAFGACLMVCCSVAPAANLLVDPPEGGYREDATPAPPAFDARRTIGISTPINTAVSVGVDPATITLGRDGVVRYVATTRSLSGGAVSAIYEGVRCATAQVKVYARHFAEGEWRPIDEPKWQSLYDAGPSRYSLPIATAGICRESAPNGSAEQIVKDLRTPSLTLSP